MSKEGKSVAFFGGIDYDMLRAQKYDLDILIRSRREHYEEDDAVNESLLGILHLIDAVQAHACDALSMGEVAVFAVDEEGEEEKPVVESVIVDEAGLLLAVQGFQSGDLDEIDLASMIEGFEEWAKESDSGSARRIREARDCGHAQSASLRGEPCRACALQVEEG